MNNHTLGVKTEQIDSIFEILPRLLQRSKDCRGHYSTTYHATSQWVMRNDTHLLLSQCEEIRIFDVQNHVNYM